MFLYSTLACALWQVIHIFELFCLHFRNLCTFNLQIPYVSIIPTVSLSTMVQHGRSCVVPYFASTCTSKSISLYFHNQLPNFSHCSYTMKYAKKKKEKNALLHAGGKIPQGSNVVDRIGYTGTNRNYEFVFDSATLLGIVFHSSI